MEPRDAAVAPVDPARVTVEQARAHAAGLYPRSKGYQRAFAAGARAALEGRPPSACPYSRSRVGAKSWRNAWRGVWLGGYQYAAPAPRA